MVGRWFTSHLWVQAKDGYTNLTENVAECVKMSEVHYGHVLVQTMHTTTALLVQEDEPGFIHDLQKRLGVLFPKDLYYEHDDLLKRKHPQPDERKNGFAHCRAALFPASVTLIVDAGKLVLGQWQQILFFDFDPEGRPPRTVRVVVMRTV